MKYFLLNSECYFIKGALRGAIYNCHSGKILSLDPQLTQIIKKSENGTPLKEIPEYFNYEETADKALTQLRKMDIGKFYERFYRIEKLKPPITRNHFLEGDLPVLAVGYIELTNSCNLDCVFCKGNTYKVNRITGCKRFPDNSAQKKIGVHQGKEIIKNYKYLGCRKLIFIGGEPLLEKELFILLVKYARTIDIQNIELFTNGLLIDNSVIETFKEYNVHPIIQVYSHSEKVTDSITRKPGTHKLLEKNLILLQKNGIKFSLSYVIMERYFNYYEKTSEYLEKFKPVRIFKSYIYPTIKPKENGKDNGYYMSICRHNPNDIFPGNLPKEEFYLNCERNHCWFGKIAVTENGDILPCPLARKETIGNMLTNEFWDVVEKQNLSPYWNMSRENIEICKDCEYRFFCRDCRPLEKSTSNSNKLNRRTNYCLYNPYTGEWGDKKNGK
ncbi:MAG: radical SAM protein [Ignavibacteria bacterium]|jgi:radical SAM protein with 4Fe4S-binding SPASM domain